MATTHDNTQRRERFAVSVSAPLFGEITPANAGWTISRLVIAWFFVVAFQLLALGANFGVSEIPRVVASFHLWSLAGAYFIWSRKSRAVALAQFAYVILVAFTAMIPYVSDVPPSNLLGILLGIFMAGVAWRNLHATWIYQRAATSRTEWKHVAVVAGLMAISVPGVVFGTIAAMEWLYPDADKLEVEAAAGTSFATFPLMMGLLTWKFPFAKCPATKDVAAVFD